MPLRNIMDGACPICKGEIKGACSCGLNHLFCIHGHEWYLQGEELVIGSRPKECKPGGGELDVKVVSHDEQGIIQLQFSEAVTHFEMTPRTAQQLIFHLMNHTFKVLHNNRAKKE